MIQRTVYGDEEQLQKYIWATLNLSFRTFAAVLLETPLISVFRSPLSLSFYPVQTWFVLPRHNSPLALGTWQPFEERLGQQPLRALSNGQHIHTDLDYCLYRASHYTWGNSHHLIPCTILHIGYHEQACIQIGCIAHNMQRPVMQMGNTCKYKLEEGSLVRLTGGPVDCGELGSSCPAVTEVSAAGPLGTSWAFSTSWVHCLQHIFLSFKAKTSCGHIDKV